MICFQISIFEPLETTIPLYIATLRMLWFAFKLVSLNHWKQRITDRMRKNLVVICFQISIFEPLETTNRAKCRRQTVLWFAFKLVSLNHWNNPGKQFTVNISVVICFQISIFEPLETTYPQIFHHKRRLWFAFKLVSLNHWKQHFSESPRGNRVVICFQISIFEPLETTKG